MQFPYLLTIIGIYFISLAGNIGIRKAPEVYVDVVENGIRLSAVTLYPELKEKYFLADSVMLHYFELERAGAKQCIYHRKKRTLKIKGKCKRHYKCPNKIEKTEPTAKFELERNTFFAATMKMSEEEWDKFVEKASGSILCVEYLDSKNGE